MSPSRSMFVLVLSSVLSVVAPPCGTAFDAEIFLVDHVAGFERLVTVRPAGDPNLHVAVLAVREEGEEERIVPGVALISTGEGRPRLLQVEYQSLPSGIVVVEDGIDLERFDGGKGEPLFLLRCSCSSSSAQAGRFDMEERLFHVRAERLVGLARVSWGGDDEVIEGRRILSDGDELVGVALFRQEPARPFADLCQVEGLWARRASGWGPAEKTLGWRMVRAAAYPYLPEDLEGLTSDELRLCRNAIFARYGRAFAAPDLCSFFLQRPWYAVDDMYDPERLSDLDWRNVDLLVRLEELGRLASASGRGRHL